MNDNPVDTIELLNGIRNIVQMVRTYYDEALEQGFDKRQALALAVNYQEAMLAGAMRGGGGE